MSQWGAEGMAEDALKDLQNKEKAKQEAKKKRKSEDKNQKDKESEVKGKNNEPKILSLETDFYQKIIEHYFSCCVIRKVY